MVVAAVEGLVLSLPNVSKGVRRCNRFGGGGGEGMSDGPVHFYSSFKIDIITE
jgi:hypothetical protein